MKAKLTLQEKLRDLREEKKLTLAEVESATDISLSALQRAESNDDVRMSYKDIATLAKFYNVSTDYLFGLTDNRQYRNIEIDALSISDDFIAVLKSKKLNNRLISELMSHPDFQQLLSAIEVYLDKKLLSQMNNMNLIYRLAESTIKENAKVPPNDEIIKILEQTPIDEDEYLRFRISERFNIIMKSMFEEHKKDIKADEEHEIFAQIKDGLQTYLEYKNDPVYGRYRVLLKQAGININDLTIDEQATIFGAFQKYGRFTQPIKRRR